MIVSATPLRNGTQTFQVRLFVPHDAYHIDLSEFFRTRRQRRRRNLNGVVIRFLPPRKRFQDPSRLFSRAAPKLCHPNRRRQAPYNFSCMLFQQPRVGPRQSVLRQNANRPEQYRAYFAGQKFWWQPPWFRFGKALAIARRESRPVPAG